MIEPSHLDTTRQSYDAVAADYARSVKDPCEPDPLSRAVLAAFAELASCRVLAYACSRPSQTIGPPWGRASILRLRWGRLFPHVIFAP